MSVQVVRVRLLRFRGFADMTMTFGEHVVLVGEPRAGRSDLIAGLRRVLDINSTNARVDPLDVHQPPEPAAEDEPPLTEVEVSLMDLGGDLEQDLDAHLELLDCETGEPADVTTKDPELGLRLCYRLSYDRATGVGTHWVDYPKESDPSNQVWARRMSRVPWNFGGGPLIVRPR